jgi:hypothetical protein
MKGGDTLFIRGGTYNGIVDIYGPSGLSTSSPTTIKAYNGESVIFKGTGISSGSDSINGVNHFVIDGITYTNFNIGFIVQSVNDVTIRNSTVHDVGQQGWFVHTNSSYVTLDHDTAYNTGLLPSYNGEGIYIGTSASSAPYDNTNNITVTNNTVYNTSDEGIELKNASYKVLVDGNTFTNVNNANNSYGLGGGAIEINQSGGYNGNPQDIIRNNVVSNTPIGIRVDTGSTVYNNIVYGVSGTGIKVDSGDSYTRNIYFNTIDAATTKAFVSGNNQVVKNNIGPSSSGNIANNTAFYVNAANHDYHLVAGSAALNVGTSISGITTDKDGVTRASPPDMGAYEYTGTVTNPPAADTIAPVVTFTIPSTSSSLTVNFTAFSATDAVGVTGYMVTETSAAPLATASGWTTAPSIGYIFTTVGSHTLYAWAKDAAGNVSANKSAAVTVTINTSSGQTVTAASCSSADVQNAINSVASGGTVAVPAGNCTWNTGVTISGKKLTLQGNGDSGTAATNITAGAWPTLNLSVSKANFVIVAGFHFDDLSHANDQMVSISGGVGTSPSSGDVGFRFHNNTMVNVGIGVIVSGNMYGLIDHNTMSGTNSQMIRVLGDYNPTNGSLAWDVPLQLGTNQFVYIEDNTFTGQSFCDGGTDSFNGGRSVLRHNVLNSCSGGGHGTDSGYHRSMAFQQISNNTYNYVAGDVDKRIATNRGGTMLVFDNVQGVPGVVNGVTIQYWRMTDGSTTSFSDWGRCNGTQYRMKTTFDGVGGTLNSLATDPDAWGTGSNYTGYFDGSTNNPGYPCRDQPGRGPRQVLMPIYLWNNTPTLGNAGTWCSGNTSCQMDTGIQENRDYYNYVSSGFNGTVGVGRGTTAARPATCIAGVAYWSTTDSTLYQCQSGNTWTPYFKEFSYPYPLAANGMPL